MFRFSFLSAEQQIVSDWLREGIVRESHVFKYQRGAGRTRRATRTGEPKAEREGRAGPRPPPGPLPRSPNTHAGRARRARTCPRSPAARTRGWPRVTKRVRDAAPAPLRRRRLGHGCPKPVSCSACRCRGIKSTHALRSAVQQTPPRALVRFQVPATRGVVLPPFLVSP